MNPLKVQKTSNKPLENNNLYYWQVNEYDAILHLGKMKKAVIIRKILGKNKWFISEASYFPFSNDIYNERFLDIITAQNVAIAYISDWFQETLNSLK